MAEMEPAVYKAAEAAKLLKCTRAALLKECREGRWGASVRLYLNPWAKQLSVYSVDFLRQFLCPRLERLNSGVLSLDLAQILGLPSE